MCGNPHILKSTKALKSEKSQGGPTIVSGLVWSPSGSVMHGYTTNYIFMLPIYLAMKQTSDDVKQYIKKYLLLLELYTYVLSCT